MGQGPLAGDDFQARFRKRILAGCVLAAFVAWMYWPVGCELVRQWMASDVASYGILIPPICTYVVWLQRKTTFGLPASPDLRGLFLVFLACLCFLVGSLTSGFFIRQVSFVVLLAGLVWTFWGVPRLKSLSFPLILLLTMIPLPAVVLNKLASPLQLLASEIATRVAQGAGVSVYRGGNVIQLATLRLGVAEACSGLSSLFTLIVAALLLGHLHRSSVLVRSLLVAVSVPIAIAVNVLRIGATAILADRNPSLALGFYHSFSGWLIFLVGFGLLWLVSGIAGRMASGANA